MLRYSEIKEKNKREIVLLRGNGCKWRRCRFCDYHLDYSSDEKENEKLNEEVLREVTGMYGVLEVVNSGSFVDLPESTMKKIMRICKEKEIRRLHFECHWKDRAAIEELRNRFEKAGVVIKMKIGVETFDELFRESYLDKGMEGVNAEEIAQIYDECCLLQGIPGQSVDSMKKDIETGLKYFERVCINIMEENSKKIKPDPSVIELFKKKLYSIYKEDKRVDILMNNTDFGVGGKEDE